MNGIVKYQCKHGRPVDPGDRESFQKVMRSIKNVLSSKFFQIEEVKVNWTKLIRGYVMYSFVITCSSIFQIICLHRIYVVICHIVLFLCYVLSYLIISHGFITLYQVMFVVVYFIILYIQSFNISSMT